MQDKDISQALRERIRSAAADGTGLCLRGGGTKDFYGRTLQGEVLDLNPHRGIISYEPTELVLTARAGTPLEEVQAALADKGQMLPFEPPRFAPGGTIGGAVASGLAGPRRPWGGAPRDLLLGVKLLDGKGDILSFGGQVMKNVAGYDLSRLMAGALGTLGVLLEVSLKVLPHPAQEWSLNLAASGGQALELMNRLQGRPVPLSGACHMDGVLHLRLAASEDYAGACARELGARLETTGDFWRSLRDQQLDFFQRTDPLWRISVPPATPQPQPALIDWGGAQRWLYAQADMQDPREFAQAAGGHATLFRGGDRSGDIFQPLGRMEGRLHSRLKAVFDPHHILNPGRLHRDSLNLKKLAADA